MDSSINKNNESNNSNKHIINEMIATTTTITTTTITTTTTTTTTITTTSTITTTTTTATKTTRHLLSRLSAHLIVVIDYGKAPDVGLGRVAPRPTNRVQVKSVKIQIGEKVSVEGAQGIHLN